jgi:EAL domain-containing protein (putative c-di-GMP-specific phosphodiesterase class I)
VNLSVGQVVNGERLYRAVAQALQRRGIDPATLELELTETHLMQNIEDKAALLEPPGRARRGPGDRRLRHRLLVAFVPQAAAGRLDQDRQLVRARHRRRPNDEAIITAILAMAHSLRLAVVAEGVETEAQFRALQTLGCDEYQGYYESAALPAAEFEARYLKR